MELRQKESVKKAEVNLTRENILYLAHFSLRIVSQGDYGLRQ